MPNIKVKDLPKNLQRLLIAHEERFFRSDMTADEQDFEEQIEWLLNSDINDIDFLFSIYAEQVEQRSDEIGEQSSNNNERKL